MLQKLYEKETEQAAKFSGNYTKEYLDWRRNLKDGKNIELLTEEDE